jgi:electron transfer flavoprotein alpha subunit
MSEQSQSTQTQNTPSASEDCSYRHIYVVIEHDGGKPVPVSLEMLGEARRQMDIFNAKYSSIEKVVAVVLGNNVRNLCEEMIYYGADAVIYAASPELQYSRNLTDTKVISKIARNAELTRNFSPEYADSFKRPRYMFFAADSIGRHLSSTVMAELESGLASDINKLVISDLDIRHEHKTKGQTIRYEKTLEMYRPDFSGFLWTTILCLDNRNPVAPKGFHPQSCSIIPGVFEPLGRDTSRKGSIVDYTPEFGEHDLAVKVLGRQVIKSAVDFESHKAVISFGRGIKESPEENIKMVAELAEELDAAVGISLPISKKPYPVSEATSSTYMIPDRVIGTSGRKVAPMLYIAVGISGAVQHIVGMKESGFVIAINPDEEAPIRGECDMFIKGRMEEVVPLLVQELKKQRPAMQVSNR